MQNVLPKRDNIEKKKEEEEEGKYSPSLGTV